MDLLLFNAVIAVAVTALAAGAADLTYTLTAGSRRATVAAGVLTFIAVFLFVALQLSPFRGLPS